MGCCGIPPPPELGRDVEFDPVLNSVVRVDRTVPVPRLESRFEYALSVALSTASLSPRLSPEYKNPPIPVAVGAMVIVLVPTTRMVVSTPVPVPELVPKLT